MKGPERTVILSPLDWGLGHATRCIPIARALIQDGFRPVLAGSGPSIELISREFPQLKTYQLPSYNIRYTERSTLLKMNLLRQIPAVLKTIRREYQLIQQIVAKEKAIGIISDNRFGVRSDRVKSIYITHQLEVRTGWSTPLTTRWHHRLISKFDTCWVCDQFGEESLAGQLSNQPGDLSSVSWIGPLSRFSPSKKVKKDIDIAVVLSGPEPSRSVFEQVVRKELHSVSGKIILVRGVIENKPSIVTEENLEVYNFALGNQLEEIMKRSKLIICRSGYSSIMDMNAIGARALLIPTPGQPEQEYLAQHLQNKGICPFVEQASFGPEVLRSALEYPGFKKKASKNEVDSSFFDAFR